MTTSDLENWRKIKTALEAAGKTDTHYYKRAVQILAGRPDPFDAQPLSFNRSELYDNP